MAQFCNVHSLVCAWFNLPSLLNVISCFYWSHYMSLLCCFIRPWNNQLLFYVHACCLVCYMFCTHRFPPCTQSKKFCQTNNFCFKRANVGQDYTFAKIGTRLFVKNITIIILIIYPFPRVKCVELNPLNSTIIRSNT